MPTSVFSLEVSLPLERARAVVRGAIDEARRRSFDPLVVLVIDAGGEIVALEREDGVGPLRQRVAYAKAFTAIGFGRGSATTFQRMEGQHGFMATVAAASDGRFMPLPGGVLLLNESQRVIGAVGVSGDTADGDAVAALAGVAAAGLETAEAPV